MKDREFIDQLLMKDSALWNELVSYYHVYVVTTDGLEW
jgi:hypothetical protein